LSKQTTPDGFTSMHWHYSASAVRVPEKVMAALDADHVKSQLAQGPDELRARD
jgi:hypothetical protein